MNYELLIELLKRDRSCRRFDESLPVSAETIEKILDAVRFTPSGRNIQAVAYRVVTDAAEREALFALLAWAGYLPDWAGPAEGERPTAYLVQCIDTEVSPNVMCDDGLQLEALTLAATSLGLGCCIIKSFNPQKTADLLRLGDRYKPIHVVALGVPVENIVIDELPVGSKSQDSSNIRYWREADGTHHVPKRPLADIVIK